MKLKYFQQQGWPKEWIDIAEAIIREEFEKYVNKNKIQGKQVCVLSPNWVLVVRYNLSGTYR
jgi:hypothetical protein